MSDDQTVQELKQSIEGAEQQCQELAQKMCRIAEDAQSAAAHDGLPGTKRAVHALCERIETGLREARNMSTDLDSNIEKAREAAREATSATDPG